MDLDFASLLDLEALGEDGSKAGGFSGSAVCWVERAGEKRGRKVR